MKKIGLGALVILALICIALMIYAIGYIMQNVINVLFGNNIIATFTNQFLNNWLIRAVAGIALLTLCDGIGHLVEKWLRQKVQRLEPIEEKK